MKTVTLNANHFVNFNLFLMNFDKLAFFLIFFVVSSIGFGCFGCKASVDSETSGWKNLDNF